MRQEATYEYCLSPETYSDCTQKMHLQSKDKLVLLVKVSPICRNKCILKAMRQEVTYEDILGYPYLWKYNLLETYVKHIALL